MENKAKISVFGAGKMGTGIALQFAVTGFPVKLLAFDVREQQTSAGVIEDNLKLLAENGWWMPTGVTKSGSALILCWTLTRCP